MNEIAIEVSGLGFRYATRLHPALRDVSFAIRRGEMALLLGPSGSGKTTLALCLNGLIPHQIEGDWSGKVTIAGLDVAETQSSLLAQQVGMVFQDPESQFCMLTVEEELAFGLENLAIPRDRMDERIDGALAELGLEHLRRARLDRLSGGTKQKVALAAALAMGCHILVLDEPTANLDPQGTADVFELLARLKLTGSYTIVVVEHKLDELAHLCDHVIVLDSNGRTVADGDPRTVVATQAADLRSQGVWLPQVADLSLELREAGVADLDPLPLTVEEAALALQDLNGRLSKAQPTTFPKEVVTPPSEIPASGPPALETRGLYFTYPGYPPTLKGADLVVQQGGFLALVGPNAAGKTTLALHLAGVLQPQLGKVLVFGKDVRQLSLRDLTRHVGFVFQNPEHQFVADSVFDELAYSLRARHLPESHIRESVEAALSDFGLANLAKANPFTLSQGQKRRLSVATMLIVGQEILVLDEPTYGQDTRNTRQLASHLLRLNAAGKTIVVITHDMRFVAEYCRSVAVMLDGRIAYQGSVPGMFEDTRLLEEAALARPALLDLSLHLQQTHPGFPPLHSVSQFREYLGDAVSHQKKARP